jgi:hypothetical protein
MKICSSNSWVMHHLSPTVRGGSVDRLIPISVLWTLSARFGMHMENDVFKAYLNMHDGHWLSAPFSST